jgi:hypothetical protein
VFVLTSFFPRLDTFLMQRQLYEQQGSGMTFGLGRVHKPIVVNFLTRGYTPQFTVVITA